MHNLIYCQLHIVRDTALRSGPVMRSRCSVSVSLDAAAAAAGVDVLSMATAIAYGDVQDKSLSVVPSL